MALMIEVNLLAESYRGSEDRMMRKLMSSNGYGIKDLEGNDPITFQKEADWWNLTASVSSAKITQTTSTKKWLLGGQNILGHPGKSTGGMGFTRTYTNLPPHNFVGISVVFWYFDSLWGSQYTPPVEISLGSALLPNPRILQQDFTTFDGGIVGEKDLGRVHVKYGSFHYESSLTLMIKSQGTSSSELQSFGFRELHLHFSYYSGVFGIACQTSEDASQLTWERCPCSINQAWDPQANCVSCAANCDLCLGPGANECVACSAGTYWDGTKCNTCDLGCQTCNGTTSHDCLSCKYGFYNYGNNTCTGSCEPPFVTEQRESELFCKKKCDSSQFYWAENKTCLNQCDFPLTSGFDENGIQICSNPCPILNYYLYANGSCESTCPAPLLTRFKPGVKFCVNPCSETDYLFPNRSCMSTCSSPLLSRSEPGAKYCWSPCALKGDFLYNNGSCEKICPPPLISRSEPGFKYCLTPCGSVNDFIYDNRSCGTSCSSPLVSRTEPLIAQYCLNPCSSSNYFLYPNGSCFRECNWPLLRRSESGIRYCLSPCASSSDYIYPNGTCESNCPYPLMKRVESGFNYCFTPCKADGYLYNDQSCYDHCDSPLIKRVQHSGIKYCDTPCSEDEYVYRDGTCSSKCEYPYKVLSNPSYKVCSMNVDSIQMGQVHSLARATNIANTLCEIGGLLTGLVTPGDPTSMLMWSLLKMLQFTKYMDVNFPAQMTVIFAQQNGLGKFSSYDLPRSFLENYWQQLLVFGALLILIIFSKTLLHFLKNPQSIKFVKHLKSALQWNVVIMFFCGSYGDLALSFTIEFQTASLKSRGAGMDCIICLFMAIIAVYIPVKILYVIKSIRKGDGESEIEKSWAKNRVLFESFQSEHFIQHIFLLIYLIRVAIFNIIIGYIPKSPLAQALLINFLNLGMMLYLLRRNPFRDRFCFAQHATMESMLFIYNFCLFILVMMDLAEVEIESTRAFLGGIMLFVIIMAPMSAAVLIVLKLTLKLQAIYHTSINQKDVIGNEFRFKKVRAHGNSIAGDDDEIKNKIDELQKLTIVADDSQLRMRETDKNCEISIGRKMKNRLTDQRSFMNMNFQENLGTATAQKARKFNVFKNDDYLPD